MTDKRKIEPIEAWAVVDCLGDIRPHTLRARKKSAVELAHGHIDAQVVKVRIVPDEQDGCPYCGRRIEEE